METSSDHEMEKKIICKYSPFKKCFKPIIQASLIYSYENYATTVKIESLNLFLVLKLQTLQYFRCKFGYEDYI